MFTFSFKQRNQFCSMWKNVNKFPISWMLLTDIKEIWSDCILLLNSSLGSLICNYIWSIRLQDRIICQDLYSQRKNDLWWRPLSPDQHSYPQTGVTHPSIQILMVCLPHGPDSAIIHAKHNSIPYSFTNIKSQGLI